MQTVHQQEYDQSAFEYDNEEVKMDDDENQRLIAELMQQDLQAEEAAKKPV